MLENGDITFLENRNCILMGELEECERFYCSFCDSLNINYIVLDKEYHVRLNMDGLYIKYSDIETDLMDYYIILCQKTCIGNSAWDDIFYKKGLYFKFDYIDSQYFFMQARSEREAVFGKKEIWIFGAGNNGEQFWKAYNKEYHIGGFVSNYEDEKQKCGLPVVRLDELDNRKNIFIVISSMYEMDIYVQLLQMGMKIEQDFTFSAFFPKRLFFGVGTCQVYYCVRMLLGNRNFTSKFVCMTFGENYESYASMADRFRLKEYSMHCDVLFYQAADSQARVGLDYTYLFSQCEKTLKISIPFYYFRGIHMQMDVHWRGKKNFSIWDFEGIFSNAIIYRYRFDEEILKMIESGMDDRQIYSEILRDNYFSKNEVHRRFHSSMNAIKFLDKFSDVKIAPFIIEHYKNIPVFTDAEHMGPELQIYIADELAQKIGINGLDEESTNKLISQYNAWWPYNLYIYPSVAKALELDYWRGDMEYQNTPYAKAISMEEYIKKQIWFVRKIYNSWNSLSANERTY